MTAPFQPLADIRVLSVTVYLAGPFLSMTLARFGAEVIKVEAPGGGDPIRNSGPYAGPKGVHLERQTEDDLSIRFLKRSEGVESVTLNLKDPEGRRLFLELARQSDVLIENLSPGSMTRLGLGYEDVKAVNPGIVYCSISGYGQTGAYKDLPAHDHQIQAMSGMMDMNGHADGPPTRVGFFVGDLVTPLYAAYSILAALRQREKTGEGQHLDASMIDALATLMFMEPMEYFLQEGYPVRSGNDGRSGLTGLYRMSDGDVILTMGTVARWQGLCRALGANDLLESPRYRTDADRDAHTAELRRIIQERMAPLSCADGIARLEAEGVPVARVRTLPEAIADPQYWERGALKPMRRLGDDTPVEPGVVSGFPIRFSGEALPDLPGGAPLGHHTAEVFARLLGLDQAALDGLRARGVV